MDHRPDTADPHARTAAQDQEHEQSGDVSPEPLWPAVRTRVLHCPDDLGGDGLARDQPRSRFVLSLCRHVGPARAVRLSVVRLRAVCRSRLPGRSDYLSAIWPPHVHDRARAPERARPVRRSGDAGRSLDGVPDRSDRATGSAREHVDPMDDRPRPFVRGARLAGQAGRRVWPPVRDHHTHSAAGLSSPGPGRRSARPGHRAATRSAAVDPRVHGYPDTSPGGRHFVLAAGDRRGGRYSRLCLFQPFPQQVGRPYVHAGRGRSV